MENFGFVFFQVFIDGVWALRWPLVAVFVIFMAVQLRGFQPGERLQALLMFLYFFLVITSFWILKPIKKSLFINYYEAAGGFDLWGWHMNSPQAELLAKVLNMVVAFVAVTVFTLLVRSFRREQLTYICAVFFIASYALYSFVLGNPGALTVWSFYLFGDLFSTLMVATFFAFLNDSVEPAAAKRIYGFIGLGGVVGGFFGSTVVAANVGILDAVAWMWICVGIAVAIAIIAMGAGRQVKDLTTEQETPAAQAVEAEPQNPALEGARLALRSRYLLSVVAIVGLYEMVSTLMDFQFTSAILNYLDDPEQIGAQFAGVFSFTNLMAMIIQLFFTSLVMTRLGVGAALLFLPMAALIGSTGFMLVPALLLGSLLNTADNAFSYSINQSSKEVLYVPTTRDEKYKAKAFIDMFVQRFAKALAVGLTLLVTTVFTGFGSVRWLSLVTVVILVLSIAAARYAGRAFAEKEAAQAS